MRGRAARGRTRCRYRGAILFDQRLPVDSRRPRLWVFTSRPRKAAAAGQTGTCYPGRDVRQFLGDRIRGFMQPLRADRRGIQFGSPDAEPFTEPFHEHATCFRVIPGRRTSRDRRDGLDMAAPLIGSTGAMRRLRATIERVACTDFTDPPRGRERRRQGAGRTADPRVEPAAWRSVHRHQLRRAGRNTASRRNCSASRSARPRASADAAENSRRPMAARCSSTKSRTCPWRRRPSCSGRFRTSPSSVSAARATKRVDIRIIAATNRSLRGLVDRQLFRADLYYRLSGVDVFVPALRERKDDIAELASYFLERHRLDAAAAPVGRRHRSALILYRWPGNVRELERLIERAVALCRSEVIQLDDLPASISGDHAAILAPSLRRNDTLRAWASRYARVVVDRCQGNKRQACRVLGHQLSHAADVPAVPARRVSKRVQAPRRVARRSGRRSEPGAEETAALWIAPPGAACLRRTRPDETGQDFLWRSHVGWTPRPSRTRRSFARSVHGIPDHRSAASDGWWILAGTLVLIVGLLYAWRLQAQVPATQTAPVTRGQSGGCRLCRCSRSRRTTRSRTWVARSTSSREKRRK